jgi:hypothetical protein
MIRLIRPSHREISGSVDLVRGDSSIACCGSYHLIASFVQGCMQFPETGNVDDGTISDD